MDQNPDGDTKYPLLLLRISLILMSIEDALGVAWRLQSGVDTEALIEIKRGLCGLALRQGGAQRGLSSPPSKSSVELTLQGGESCKP